MTVCKVWYVFNVELFSNLLATYYQLLFNIYCSVNNSSIFLFSTE